MEIENFSMN